MYFLCIKSQILIILADSQGISSNKSQMVQTHDGKSVFLTHLPGYVFLIIHLKGE